MRNYQTEHSERFISANVNKQLVKRRFERHAKEYDGYAEVQRVMAKKLTDRICHSVRNAFRISRPVRILDIGCGTGMLSECLARAFPGAELTLVDLSPRMLDQACTKLRRAGVSLGKGNVIAADAEVLFHDWDQAQQDKPAFDIIASSAAFQWFNYPKDTIHRLSRLLTAGGLLAFATFLPGTVGELHDSFQYAEAALGLPSEPHGQSYPSKEDWIAWLSDGRGNDDEIDWESQSYRYTFPNVEGALAQVRRVGAGNAVNVRHDARTNSATMNQGTTRRALFQTMLRTYERTFRQDDGLIPLTYEVAYCLTWPSGMTRVPR